MQHLTTERLAAAADDTPTPDEATHLAGCWECRAELAAYRRLARMAAMAPVPNEPLTAWSQLSAQLRSEGLLVDAAPGHGRGGAGGGAGFHAGVPVLPFMRPQRTAGFSRWALRAAAALALLFGGAMLGRLSTGLPFATDSRVADAFPVGRELEFSSPDEAVRALTVAQQQYQSAAAFLAAQDTSSRFIGMNNDMYRARLAALDEIAAATRAALYRAPQDPMLNQYYLTTLGAREATLREIGATLPDTRRLERY